MVDTFEGIADVPPAPSRRRVTFGRAALPIALLPGLAVALMAAFPAG